MKVDTPSGTGLTHLRSGAKSLLSILLSIVFVFPTGIALPTPAATTAKDKKVKQDPALKGLPITELSADEAILHALNRLAYGPRPGDVERVRQMGLAKWIEQQMNPNAIDDRGVEARLEQFPTLRMSTAKLLAEYPQPKQQEKQAAVKEARMERAGDAAAATIARDMSDKGGQAPQEQTAGAENAESMKDDANAAAAMKQEPPAEMNAATRGAGKRDLLGGGDPNAVPRAIADDSKRPQRVVEELAMSKVARAIYSERQLQQVMDDFWFNHFNVFAGKGEDRWFLTSYEGEVIQPHTMGKFKDLLTATAKSPAMLFYLDNFLSADPRAPDRLAAQRAARQWRRGGFGRPFPPRPAQQQGKKNVRGLNENYGRELMELHTLGVDGGYTQKDVTEVARCFTGWTIDKPRQYADFKFDDTLHDPDPKYVLGKKIHAGGMKDGEQVIDLLVHHPNTAKFISTKLARRFVSDNPPPALVDRMAQTFLKKDGDIREVLKTMLRSPEFWSPDAYRAKVKTPLEYVISALRISGADVTDAMPIARTLQQMGMPPYGMQPPTGYSMKAEAWVNSSALLGRMNFAMRLASGKINGVAVPPVQVSGAGGVFGPEQALVSLETTLLAGDVSKQTRETIAAQLNDPKISQRRLDDPARPPDVSAIEGLLLGSPEFQRR